MTCLWLDIGYLFHFALLYCLVEEEKEDQYNGSPPRPQPRGPRTPPGPPPPDDDDDDEPMPAAGTSPVIGSMMILAVFAALVNFSNINQC